jgi:hypothetical protein
MTNPPAALRGDVTGTLQAAVAIDTSPRDSAS